MESLTSYCQNNCRRTEKNWISTEWPCDWVWCKNLGNSFCEDGDKDSLMNCSREGTYALVFKMNWEWMTNDWQNDHCGQNCVFTITGRENLQAHPTKKRAISKLKVKKMFSCFFQCNQVVHCELPQPDQTMSIISKLWQVCDSRFIVRPVLSLTSALCTMMCPHTQHHPWRRIWPPTPNWSLSW